MRPALARDLVAFLAILALSSSPVIAAKGSGHGGHAASHGKSASKSHATKAPKAARAPKAEKTPAVVTARDARVHIKRSEAAKRAFERQSGFPKGRRGYVVDHIRPLACGGADVPSNMQWQTTAEAKAKDGWERVGCR
jgi:hypothetical protein